MSGFVSLCQSTVSAMGSDGSRHRHVLVGGGIGAGKSTLVQAFADRGFRVISADAVAAQVLAPDTDATKGVSALWPEVVIGGVIDRQALARIVFADPHELTRLESITHPLIVSEIEREVSMNQSDVVVEIPLPGLKLSGDWLRVAVVAPEEVRVQRAVARGGNIDDVRRRVAAQVTEDDWRTWADVVVNNAGELATGFDVMNAVVDEVLS